MAEAVASSAVSLAYGFAKEAREMVMADRDLQEYLVSALRDIDCELGFLKMKMSESNEGHGEPQEWNLQLHELVYNIEDFLADRSQDRKTSALARLLKAAFEGDPRPGHVRRVLEFKNKMKEIKEEARTASPAAAAAPPLGGTTAGASRRPLVSAPPRDHPDPVGMEQPKKEVIELLVAAGGHDHEDERKVISIVGCAGVGKTTLAKALWYDPDVQGRFLPHCAWVPAPQSADQVHSVLESLLQHFRRHGNRKGRNRQHCRGRAQEADDAAGGVELQQLQCGLQEFLRNKRYLVIVDGVPQRGVLNTILSALPKNKMGSRVVVTTSICSVVKGVSSGGYLYTMRGLDRADTEYLFWKTLNLNDQELRPSPAVQAELKTFFDKCDGLPRVVVAASKFLRDHGATHDANRCKKVGTALGNHLAGSDPDSAQSFAEASTALARYWHSLDQYEQKMCMFSLSSFPKDDDGGIKRKSLLRRWVAEGLVAQDIGKWKDEVACQHWDKLLDLGVVSSSRMGRNNRGQVHGVTLEYLVHRSVAWNFIALVQEGEPLPRGGAATCCKIRRVAIHGGGEEGKIDKEAEVRDLSGVRSLTVRRTTKFPASLLERCRMLRVLDLEGCDWHGIGSETDDHVVRLICELLHLRYLSLRSTGVAKIPKAIIRLQSLETLDVRDTEVVELPMQVFMLPQLAHLFGSFELPAYPKKKLENFLSKSKLVTLAGFKVVNSKRRGHEHILRHARNLRKVKIWCELPPDAATIPPPKGMFAALRYRRICRDVATRPMNMNCNKVDAVSSSPDDTPSILDGLVTHLESRFIGSNALNSLSIDFQGGHHSRFLERVLKDSCLVNSIKVRGRMEHLPGSPELMKLQHIKELHLCNTGLGTKKLSVLQSMHYLVYLKLTEEEDTTQGFEDGSFDVYAGGFPSLQHLCFHGKRLRAVKFTEGSMKALLTLQLICPDLGPAGSDDRGVTGVANLPLLDEVILHHNAPDETEKAWREETLKHSRKPKVKKQQGSSPTSNK